MRRLLPIALLLFTTFATPAHAAEIGFIEDFSLATDRTVPLKQLIPGTEEHYYYHCLHYQNTQQFDKVEQMLVPWIKRYGYTAYVTEIRNRQALLTYEKNPAKSLEFIRQQLNIQFNHQRVVIGEKPNLPTDLDQKRISREALTKLAMQRHKNLQGFENSALDWLVATQLNTVQRRDLLTRLQRPDYPNLPKLVVDDLNQKDSRGFGSLNIHRAMLLPQLDECLKLRPGLLNESNFVNTYLIKLRPAAGIDWQHDAEEHQAFLARQWKFVSRLAPVHNSLKTHILYQQLDFDRSRGVYDKERFMKYIQLPRQAPYVNPEYLRREEHRRFIANLNQDFQNVTMLPRIGNDEMLVRDFLQHFFVDDADYKAYTDFISDQYLKHLFAETKIVNGLGDAEQWYSMLPPELYKALKERVDIEFAATNHRVFGADEAVSLDADVKNVSALIVKVFEINTQNYYRENGREVNSDINLDGLVANQEDTYQYKEPALRRVRRHFDFPDLKKPGVYVVDFIGNGKSSRAVIRKGNLRHLVRTSVAGHVFTVLDEKSNKLNDAKLWLDGHQYEADKHGHITVPFTSQPRRQSIVLSHGDLHSPQTFDHQSENYTLSAGIYVDRESLLKRKVAQVVIRPGLILNGTPVPLAILEDVQLAITSRNHDGVSTTKEFKGLELHGDKELVVDFQVPDRLASIDFTLTARVQNISQNKKNDLRSGQSFSINEIDRTDKIEDLHFACMDGSYIVELLGKTGEPIADRAVQVTIKHKDFRDAANFTLKSDLRGRISLGGLQDVAQVTATGPQGTSHSWLLPTDATTRAAAVHGQVGEEIVLAYLGSQQKPARDEVSLLEIRGGSFTTDHFDALSIKGGLLRINGLPAGDYDLWLKKENQHITVRLVEGKRAEGYVLGEHRQLEIRNDRPLQIAGLFPGEDSVTVQLANASDEVRVHVFATRMQPAFSAFANLSRVGDVEPYLLDIPTVESLFLEGRNIGDELRYILDRKYAKKYPGNMLERPSLLLNPWPIRSTQTSRLDAAAGEAFDAREPSAEARGGRGEGKGEGAGVRGDFANLDFLGEGSAVLLNLTADDKGAIVIEREKLGPHQQLHIVAIDPNSTVYRSLSLPEIEIDYANLRLVDGLDPNGHFTQQKQISIVPADSKFELADITTSKFEAYDSLASVYGLFTTLSSDAKLAEFRFILDWPTLDDDEKIAKYSKYACHELNFFLARRDAKFYEQVVQPFLANKKDKTFLDSWLLQQDVRGHLKPWPYARLNIVERILLGQRVKPDTVFASRHVQELFDLLPPNIEQDNLFFDTAIKGLSLDTGDRFGLASATEKAAAKKSNMARDGNRAAGFGGGGGNATPPPAPTARPGMVAGAVPNFKQQNRRSLERLQKDIEGAELSLSDRRRKLSEAEVDMKRRAATRNFYQQLDKTQEWVENNYYRLPIEQQNASLVTVNDFWNDYGQHPADKPFYSTHFPSCARNFTEMMFALSVLDLPFEAGEHKTKFDDAKMTLTSASPIIVFHEAIKKAPIGDGQTPILVSQNFFRHGDRYRYENNEKVDKYVTDEFLVHTVYGCQVVVTNPTSARQKLDILLQIPLGAMPVMNGRYTRGVHVELQPYNTQTIDYYFYFPSDGDYPHYPVHVSKNEELMAFAEPVNLKVVEQLSRVDRESWDYVSQNGTEEDVIKYLNGNNLQRTSLDKIAFRMSDEPFFQTVTGLLAKRHAYNHTLWSYALKHNSPPQARQYLQYSDGFVQRCGAYIDSPLLTIDPVERRSYQHMDYRPLVNARTHQLGRRRQIMNDRLHAQYHRLLRILSYRRELADDDLMSVTYYMLLQDRIGDALSHFKRVNAAHLVTGLQHDYFTAYLDFYSDDHKLAAGIVDKYADFPVERWRNAFANIGNQLDEIDGGAAKIADAENRDQNQANLAASAPSFEFRVEDRQVRIDYQNLSHVRVNYYLMDIELLFSRNPFVQQFSGQFSHIRPNGVQTIELPEGQSTHSFALPKEFHNSNVLVEMIGHGETRTQAYYSNSLALQLVETYGQLRITEAESNKPISTAYVKVYAQMQDGSVRFFKDGYTDLRGRFDYTSLNTNELDFVKRFSLLVMTDNHGAVVREAAPPKR